MKSWFNPSKQYQAATERAYRLYLALLKKHYPGQETVPHKNLDILIDQIDNITAALVLPTPAILRTYLIDIRKNGRSLVLTFCRGDDIWTIETYGTIADDVDGWKERAGLK